MIKDLCAATVQSFKEGTFVRLTLGGYEGGDTTLKKITVRPVIIKREEKISFTYSHKTNDIVKNYGLDEALSRIEQYLESGFKTATLFTSEFDLSYPSLKKSAPSIVATPEKSHNRAKNRHVQTAGRKYLQDLKITDAKGEVFKNAQDKYKQIDKYVEILTGLVKDLPKDKVTNIVDMGAGKGYLTFALYDYLQNSARINAVVTGVEFRADLVSLCNKIAENSGFNGLSFVEGTIENFDASAANVLIALHACDTATDDAIAKGIAAKADLIVVAPCCHKQIRREMEKASNDRLDFLLRYGTFMERQAEMVTDGIRALILEYFGYTVKVFEFISDAHTPKNVMIVAQKNGSGIKKSAHEKIKQAKADFGIAQHYLEKATGL